MPLTQIAELIVAVASLRTPHNPVAEAPSTAPSGSDAVPVARKWSQTQHASPLMSTITLYSLTLKKNLFFDWTYKDTQPSTIDQIFSDFSF